MTPADCPARGRRGLKELEAENARLEDTVADRELGWFHGRFGRGHVLALLVGDVEQPSDLSGVLYVRVDEQGAWRYRVGLELLHTGVNDDLNSLR